MEWYNYTCWLAKQEITSKKHFTNLAVFEYIARCEIADFWYEDSPSKPKVRSHVSNNGCESANL